MPLADPRDRYIAKTAAAKLSEGMRLIFAAQNALVTLPPSTADLVGKASADVNTAMSFLVVARRRLRQEAGVAIPQPAAEQLAANVSEAVGIELPVPQPAPEATTFVPAKVVGHVDLRGRVK